MDKIALQPYTPGLAPQWDRFVEESRNGTFLFLRGYMDYHADRFEDASLLACKGSRLIALLPANVRGERLQSHGGLTYGGWVLPSRHFEAADIEPLFEALAAHCRERGISEIDYKPVPHIYHRIPSQEDLFALQRMGAETAAVNLSQTVDLRSPGPFSTQQRRNLKRGLAQGVSVRRGAVADVYPLLEECLGERHGVRPVHSLGELELLATRFPENIRVHIAEAGGEPMAGVVVYADRGVAHCQYICTSAAGREAGALAVLMDHLLNREYASMRYFDFGTSNEPADGSLNAGLVRQKTGFGAGCVAYPRFTLKL